MIRNKESRSLFGQHYLIFHCIVNIKLCLVKKAPISKCSPLWGKFKKLGQKGFAIPYVNVPFSVLNSFWVKETWVEFQLKKSKSFSTRTLGPNLIGQMQFCLNKCLNCIKGQNLVNNRWSIVVVIVVVIVFVLLLVLVILLLLSLML